MEGGDENFSRSLQEMHVDNEESHIREVLFRAIAFVEELDDRFPKHAGAEEQGRDSAGVRNRMYNRDAEKGFFECCNISPGSGRYHQTDFQEVLFSHNIWGAFYSVAFCISEL